MFHNIIQIVGKPDNLPIVGMLVLIAFFGGLSFCLAFRNDRLRRINKEEAEPQKQKDVVDMLDVVYPVEEQGLSRKIHCWPYLLRIEFLAAIFIMALLIFWSIKIDAPLEEPANPSITPNPAKAPWYFLGLQDMLVYFDPWIAGVVIPGIIIFGLMAIPYVDTNPKGNGYYTFRDRWFSILTFWFGFLILWVFEIVIGTFFRGPGWMWFWPWEEWDLHRVVSETNINLNEFLGNITHIQALKSENAGFVIGFLMIASYYLIGSIIPYIILKRRNSPTFLKMGIIRYLLISFLFWTMMALPIKIVLRLLFNIKYVWVTPWFNI